MSHPMLCEDQPDLFARDTRELRAEIRRHGGGRRPRHLFSSDEAEERSTVQIRVIDVGDFWRLTQ